MAPRGARARLRSPPFCRRGARPRGRARGRHAVLARNPKLEPEVRAATSKSHVLFTEAAFRLWGARSGVRKTGGAESPRAGTRASPGGATCVAWRRMRSCLLLRLLSESPGVTARPCWPGRGSESLTAASAFISQRFGTRACAPNIPPCRRLPRSLPRPRRASPGWGFSCWARLSPAPSVGCGAGRGALHTGRPCARVPKSTLRPARRRPSRSTPRCVLTPPRRFSRSRTGRISC